MSSFFRYPGGKTKLKASIINQLSHSAHTATEYREPFFGGGGIGLDFMAHNPQFKQLWNNDKDVGIASLWTSVIRHPEQLKMLISVFTPSVTAFNQIKEELLGSHKMPADEQSIVELGFKKLAI
jgi:DNA adenine methylase